MKALCLLLLLLVLNFHGRSNGKGIHHQGDTFRYCSVSVPRIIDHPTQRSSAQKGPCPSGFSTDTLDKAYTRVPNSQTLAHLDLPFEHSQSSAMIKKPREGTLRYFFRAAAVKR